MALSSKMMSRVKPIIFFLLILPSLIWFYQFLINNLGVNPIEKLMHKLGELALRLIILTLVLSSFAKIKYFRSLQMIRRMVGLFVFYYAFLHLLTYLILDHYFNWDFIFKDIIKRPFITLGFLSFVLLIPLVLTSKDSIIKKLTYKVWKNIHKLIYLIAILAVLHFFLLTKADKLEPIIYLSIIAILYIHRIVLRIYKIKNL